MFVDQIDQDARRNLALAAVIHEKLNIAFTAFTLDFYSAYRLHWYQLHPCNNPKSIELPPIQIFNELDVIDVGNAVHDGR